MKKISYIVIFVIIPFHLYLLWGWYCDTGVIDDYYMIQVLIITLLLIAVEWMDIDTHTKIKEDGKEVL